MNDIEAKRLELAGSMARPLAWLLGLMSLPLVIGIAALSMAQTRSAHPLTGAFPGIVLLAPAIIVITALACVFLLRRASVSVMQGDLIVNTGLGRERLSLASLRAHGLKIVDLHERSELQPAIKIMGASLPGFAGGRYRLRNGERALCLMLDRRRVCYLRSDERNISLLLSLQQPETLRALIDRASGA